MSTIKPILRAVKLGTKQIDEVATAAAVSRAPVTRGLAADAAEELRRIESESNVTDLGQYKKAIDQEHDRIINEIRMRAVNELQDAKTASQLSSVDPESIHKIGDRFVSNNQTRLEVKKYDRVDDDGTVHYRVEQTFPDGSTGVVTLNNDQLVVAQKLGGVEEAVAPPKVDLQQLRDPEFSRKAVEQDSPMSNLTNPNDEGLSIESRYERWAKDNEPIEEFFRSNPRAMAIVKDFVGEDSLSAKFLADSGAEDMPLFGWHTDVATDLRSIDEGFIQTTTKANELGLHLGSKAASTDMFSPTVKKRLERDFSSLSAIFDELGDFNPEVPQIFEEAFETVRSNKHLRPGESFKDTQVPEFRALIDELFEEIAVAADSYRTGDNMELMNDLANLGNSDMMAGRIERWMKGTYDPTTVPVVVKGKNPLYVPDLEANTARRHALHQLNFGEDTLDESTLNAVVQAWDAGEYDEANALFKKALTDSGFDPVLAYHNGAEDKGVLSFIVMDDSYVMPLWGRGSSVNPMMARRMQMEYLMAPLAAMLGIGGKDATLRETK